jgi:hypothetical protein
MDSGARTSLNIDAPGTSFGECLREIVALSARGEEPDRELFERDDMHVVTQPGCSSPSSAPLEW